MKTVAHILDDKGRDVWKVGPHASVLEALEIMADKDVGALLVVEEDALVGIISERDYARKVVLEDRRSSLTPVAEIMTREVTVVGPALSVEECMALMTERRIRHLPVLSDDEIIGVVSIGDVVKAVISGLGSLVDHLEQYIRGR